MFIDKVTIKVQGGNGGSGMVAFRREKYVPKGGPAGGDGGRGGNIIFKVSNGLRTLLDFRYQKHFHAANGEDGRTKSQHGANADHKVVFVPPGTIVRDMETDVIIADLTLEDQEVVVAYGGRGGRGNIRFATPVNPAPRIAEKGEPGTFRELDLELKLLADVGLIGYPNVGKSTLLSVLSAAKPKIGAYHFTTLTPNLGVVRTPDGRDFVLADMPGLIEGAHSGIGLGHQFLRHIARTKMLIHVVDISGTEGRDPYTDWCTINEELHLYEPELSQRPQIVVLNKTDLVDDLDDKIAQFKELLGDEVAVYPISAVTQTGLNQLLYATADLLDKVIESTPIAEDMSEQTVVYAELAEDEPFIISCQHNIYYVEGRRIQRLLQMTNFDYHESLLRFAQVIKKMGLEEALRAKGAKNGDTIRIGHREFELTDNISSLDY